jgi:hypothetical protein
MDIFVAISGPLIGILGVISGTVLNEYLRRRRRVEDYSSAIFAKRLESYESLIALVHTGGEIAEEVIQNVDLSKEERHQLISSVVLPIARHVDDKRLYIDEELGAHCTALFMGIEDIHDATASDQKELLARYYQMKSETYRMISEDSGIAQINKLFNSINKPKLSGPIIQAIRELREQRRKVHRSPSY